jgi:hypothetical protein
MEVRMDAIQTDPAGAITVKIPINLPYQTNWKDFERIDGDMTYKGVTYKYFKRKIYNDSLILVCIKFKEKNIIQTANDDYFKKVNDLATSSNKKQTLKQSKVDDLYHLGRTQKNNLFATLKQPLTFRYCILYDCHFAERPYLPPRV